MPVVRNTMWYVHFTEICRNVINIRPKVNVFAFCIRPLWCSVEMEVTTKLIRNTKITTTPMVSHHIVPAYQVRNPRRPKNRSAWIFCCDKFIVVVCCSTGIGTLLHLFFISRCFWGKRLLQCVPVFVHKTAVYLGHIRTSLVVYSRHYFPDLTYTNMRWSCLRQNYLWMIVMVRGICRTFVQQYGTISLTKWRLPIHEFPWGRRPRKMYICRAKFTQLRVMPCEAQSEFCFVTRVKSFLIVWSVLRYMWQIIENVEGFLWKFYACLPCMRNTL